MLVGYYYDFSREMEKNFSKWVFDSNGIPMTDYGKKIGRKYNPVAVAEYSLAYLSLYIKTKNDKHKKTFLNGADWFLGNASEYKYNAVVWFYEYDLTECGMTEYELKSPWISAMAQGLAVSVLVRAEQLKGNNGYLDAAEKAVDIFDIPVQDGGLISHFSDGGIIFEEYPTGKMNGVLNGFIFSVLGLYDLFTHANNEKAKTLFTQSIRSLRDNITDYDAGYWSRYDLRRDGRLASVKYHKLHLELLEILYRITGDTYFIDVRNKWNGYYESLFCRLRFIFTKLFQKMLQLFRRLRYNIQ